MIWFDRSVLVSVVLLISFCWVVLIRMVLCLVNVKWVVFIMCCVLGCMGVCNEIRLVCVRFFLSVMWV